MYCSASQHLHNHPGCYVHPEINEDYLRALEKEGRGSSRMGVSKQLLASPSMKAA